MRSGGGGGGGGGGTPRSLLYTKEKRSVGGHSAFPTISRGKLQNNVKFYPPAHTYSLNTDIRERSSIVYESFIQHGA